MSKNVESCLRDLQDLSSALRLHPADHPRIREGLDRIERRVSDLTSDERELTVLCVGSKIVWEGAPLPGCDDLSRDIFAPLKRHGYDSLTFLPRVTRDEIVAFLAALTGATDGSPAPASSTHIRLAAIDVGGLDLSLEIARELLGARVGILQRVWERVLESRELDHDALESIVQMLSKIIEENLGLNMPLAELKTLEDYTATHITNVALLAMGLAEAIGVPTARAREIGIAALLHDVGKLRVPLEILGKPDRLTPEQLAEIRRHPEEGARILYATKGVPEIAVAVAYEHHIRFDGGGYPAVPSGWRTTLASAVTQVADIYDALRTDRPYRAGYAHDAIERMMRADSGSLFDPELLSVFFDLVVPKGSEPAFPIGRHATVERS